MKVRPWAVERDGDQPVPPATTRLDQIYTPPMPPPRPHFYDRYFAAGYPIASGVIEGACRHVVKDRMERARSLIGLFPAPKPC